MIFRKAYYLARLNHNLWKSKEELERHQLRLLKRIVAHAYQTVPYYRDLFKSVNFSPLAIKTLEDINRIPITRKDDLRSLDLNQRLSSKYHVNNLITYRTGGTTGKVMKFFSNYSVSDLRSASIFRTYFSNGYRPEDKIGVLQFSPLRKKLIHKFGIFQRVSIPFQLSLDEQLIMLQSLNPEVLEGYPSRLSAVSRAIIKNKIKGITPKLIITNSEALTESFKRDIISCFGIQPINVYDSWEFGNIAWECSKHEGLHINADLLKLEILNNNEEATLNEPGEITITDLYNEAMPLIQYAIGDIGVKTNRLCSCGRKFPMIEKIIGRTSGKLFLANDTGIFATTAINHIMYKTVGMSEYQTIQKKKGELEVLVIADEKFNYQKENELKKMLLDSFSLEKVNIIRVKEIPKTEVGKHMPFVSKVEK